jgi:hypothetical protein
LLKVIDWISLSVSVGRHTFPLNRLTLLVGLRYRRPREASVQPCLKWGYAFQHPISQTRDKGVQKCWVWAVKSINRTDHNITFGRKMWASKKASLVFWDAKELQRWQLLQHCQ